MYESVISHPPKDWEVIPSIDVRVGERLKEEYPDPVKRPVINIDVEAAGFALRSLQRSDAAPTIVSFRLQEGIKKPHKRSTNSIGGIAFKEGWGTDIRVNAINPDTGEPQKQKKIQEMAVHELKHAADYTSPSARLAEQEYYKSVRGIKNKLRLTWEVLLNNFWANNWKDLELYPNFNGVAASEKPRKELSVDEYIYFNSPTEITAYATAAQAQDFPRIISFDKPKKKKQAR